MVRTEPSVRVEFGWFPTPDEAAPVCARVRSGHLRAIIRNLCFNPQGRVLHAARGPRRRVVARQIAHRGEPAACPIAGGR